MLQIGRHGERRHDDHEDEQVVHAQRVLSEVPRDELAAVRHPEGDSDEHGKRRRERHVEQHPAEGVLLGELPRTMIDDHQVDHDDRDQP